MKKLNLCLSLGLMLFACSTSDATLVRRPFKDFVKTPAAPAKPAAPTPAKPEPAKPVPATLPAQAVENGYNHHHSNSSDEQFNRVDVIVDVQQRFYAFQNATSGLKQTYHSSDPTVYPEALDLFVSFFDPSINDFNIYTLNTVYSFTSVAEIAAAYTEFAAFFNGFSQHFSTNCIVTPDLCNNTAYVISGGGEWASLDFGNPYEQITISNFELTWVWLECGPSGPNWYISQYAEYGDRLYALCPPCNGFSLTYARVYPGATPECTVAGCAACACSECPPPECDDSAAAIQLAKPAAPAPIPVPAKPADKTPAKVDKTPGKDVKPAKPAKPAKPVKPAKPTKPAKPGRVVKADPDAPAASVGKARK